MSNCIVLSLQPQKSRIDAAFQVGEDWIVNRIYGPRDLNGQLIDLRDKDQVAAYLQQYGIDNYDFDGTEEALSLETMRAGLTEIQKAVKQLGERGDSMEVSYETSIRALQEEFLAITGNLKQRIMQLESEVNNAWWRQLAAWVKANSSLLGGSHA